MKIENYARLVLGICVVFIGCTGGRMKDTEEMDLHTVPVNNSELEKLSQKTIFFGHQSVGFNILEGISEIIGEHKNVNLKIVESKEIGSKKQFYHFRIGKNGDPAFKMQDFADMLDGGIGRQADIAFLKLCYIDFWFNTNVEEVFQKYRQTMERLQDSYPNVLFVHFTAPLTVRENGVKTLIKGMIGRPRWGYEDNLIREKFNRLMRDEYGQTGLVFDIARLESTLPDGSRLEYKLNDQEYFALVPEYTSDGGHLNETGRRIIANNLLHFLASIE